MPLTLNGTTGIAGVDGSASTPSVQGSDTNTGEFFPAADTIAWTTGGSERMRVNSSGDVGIGTSSPGQKLTVYSASGDSRIRMQSAGSVNTGIEMISTAGTGYFDYNNQNFNWYTNGATRMTLDSSGNLLVGTTSATGRITTKSSDSGTSLALDCLNSSNADLFYVRGDGLIFTGLAGNSPYNLTTALGANVFVQNNGYLYRSTSSLKYKTDVVDATHGLAEVMQLRPVTYKGKNDGDKVFGGLIAEEVDAVGLTEFVQYAEDGSPDALAYGNMVSLLVKAIQELSAKVDAQAAEIAALKANAPA